MHATQLTSGRGMRKSRRNTCNLRDYDRVLSSSRGGNYNGDKLGELAGQSWLRAMSTYLQIAHVANRALLDQQLCDLLPSAFSHFASDGCYKSATIELYDRRTGKAVLALDMIDGTACQLQNAGVMQTNTTTGACIQARWGERADEGLCAFSIKQIFSGGYGLHSSWLRGVEDRTHGYLRGNS
ncbi:hypothetical protein K431DRAFT_295359 [Polychaeton citri CBS 116435]|uniref:Uncharacterized protein n=1 Tax=Polychaeton citri CBS 116435 TaxID=1314669 RepID=A0A9P4Q6D7_9PEZI|nr:hypothetical protein K431DRAFT_295359 [Polychaeton citri CBS 116435]